jgi:hypothetical protein
LSNEFEELIGQTVVLDIDGPVLYIGTLAEAGSEFLVMEDVDVHNLGDSATGRELYLINARQLGVRPNRKKTRVRLARVVGISRLEDVIEF